MVTSIICTKAFYSETLTKGKVYVARPTGLYQDLLEFEDDLGNIRVINKEVMGVPDLDIGFEMVRHKERRDLHHHLGAVCGATSSLPRDSSAVNNLQRDWEGVNCPHCLSLKG